MKTLQFAPLAQAAVVAALLSALPAQAYNRVVVFGDSLSDNGNLLALSAPFVGPGGLPFPLPPAPYWQGRFSNGKAAVEHLADGLGVPLLDFAVGGATTGLTNNQVPPIPALQATGLLSQVNSFVGGGAADASSLYVVWAGPNDFLPLLSGAALDPNVIAATAISNLNNAVATLYTAGARSFLLPLLPDLGNTPRAFGLGPAASAAFSAQSAVFNANLAGSYMALQAALPGSTFFVFDTAAAQNQLVANAGLLGFTNTTQGCFSGFVDNPVGTVCATPNSYFFWDDIHPTAAVHGLLGQQMLAAVPEPSTYGLMALGLLGLALRRKR